MSDIWRDITYNNGIYKDLYQVNLGGKVRRKSDNSLLKVSKNVSCSDYVYLKTGEKYTTVTTKILADHEFFSRFPACVFGEYVKFSGKEYLELKEKIEMRHMKSTYKLISPDGLVVLFNDISKFCESHNLMIDGVYKLVRCDIESYKDWQLYDYKKIRKSKYKFINPNDELIQVDDIIQLETVYNVNAKALRVVYNGGRKSHKKWTKYTE